MSEKSDLFKMFGVENFSAPSSHVPLSPGMLVDIAKTNLMVAGIRKAITDGITISGVPAHLGVAAIAKTAGSFYGMSLAMSGENRKTVEQIWQGAFDAGFEDGVSAGEKLLKDIGLNKTKP